ncbi:MAG TPA: hypothetical protein VJZ69_02095 [Clostridia bacterium]|nr:hypothetical protein [Clostridia bacterium]
MDYKELSSIMEQLNKRLLTIEQKIKQIQTAITSLTAELEAVKVVVFAAN